MMIAIEVALLLVALVLTVLASPVLGISLAALTAGGFIYGLYKESDDDRR